MIKSLEGIIVTSKEVKRKQITFDDETGLICEVGDLKIKREDLDFYYNDNQYVFPGMIDIHIHAREDVTGKNNYKEDFISASKAAVNGGITAFIDMPNNICPPVDDKTYRDKSSLLTKSDIPIFLYAGIGGKTAPLSFNVPYKLYMTKSVGDLYIKDESHLDKVLSRYKGQMVSFHCEDGKIIADNVDQLTHLQRRPPEAEIVAIEKAIFYIAKYNLDATICHISTKEGVKKVLEAQARGIKVCSEVTPQHMYFCNEELNSSEKKFMQMNPPIRNREDQEAILQYFLDGKIDYLATDHAPHTLDEKIKGISGLTGLDSYGLFVTWLINECNMDLKKLVKTTSERPGLFVRKFFKSLQNLTSGCRNLGDGIGFIEKNYVASFTILDMSQSIKMTTNEIKSKTNWSPFNDRKFSGIVFNTIVQGKCVKR